MNANTHKIGLSTALTMLILFTGNTAFAAPGVLSDAPLFVTTSVEPNIFFTLDDSGSMDWEAVIPDTDLFDEWNNGATTYHDMYQAYYHPGWGSYRYDPGSYYDKYDLNIIPPAGYSNNSTSSVRKKWWVMQNHNFNSIYYNPLTDYKPWPGVDGSGNPLYPAADPYHVYRDPNNRDTDDDFVDLTQRYDYYHTLSSPWELLTGIAYLPSYFTWTDDNEDGVLQATEGHTLVEITPGAHTYEHLGADGEVAVTRTGTAELKNFANWFEYYRKREFATKAAIGAVIVKAGGSRMGYRLINKGHQANLKTMTDAANKLALLKSFYLIDSESGTPLRNALKYTGQMFQDSDTYNGDKVILPASEGGECQQNYALLMTDGYWNKYAPNVGNADASSDSIGFDGDQHESNDGGNYEDSYSDTLADVAMRYYETDLRSDLANKVPTTEGIDEATHQHMVTYTISFGVKGTLDIDNFDPLASGFSWPSPYSEPKDPHKVDDLLHAAYNGRGLYLSAQNPVELVASLSSALADIEERKSSQSAVSVSTSQLSSDTVVYATQFNSRGWQGNIFAYPIVEDEETGVFSLKIPAEPMDALNAAEKLAEQVKSGGFNSGRTILTKNGTRGVAFKWDSISEDMKEDLHINPGGTTSSLETAKARLDYLRGDTSNEETGEFRERAQIVPNPAIPNKSVTNLLGDIVHSSAVYVAEPAVSWPDKAPFPTGDEAYSKFKNKYTAPNTPRAGMIYVGANDGMIHGFSAEDLTEKLAYVPSYLVSTETNKGLHYLTDPNYQHRYYNDLTPAVSDIYINGDWHTIAIFGQRAGGRGYSALDITNPDFSEDTAANTVMWEFSSIDDADLGYTFSTPVIGLANNNEWVAVFGNGYNNDGTGEAALFIVKIKAGLDGSWGVTDYRKISTGSGDTSDPNGLSRPALADVNGDGTIDRAYAGDLRGQMWAFDLLDDSASNWKLAHDSTPLFTTIGQRPITTQPSISFHPSIGNDSSNAPNIMVAFGTGQYLVDADKNSSNDNYFYGIWDKGADSANLTASDLQEQTFTSSDPRLLTQNSVDYTTKFGWYIPLDIAHERSITDSFIRAGIVFFNTAIPSDDNCQTDAYGYRFIVGLATGGTPGSPNIDTNGDGEVNSEDEIAAAYKIEGEDGIPPADAQTRDHLVPGNGEDPPALPPYPDRKTGRVSWQELLK